MKTLRGYAFPAVLAVFQIVFLILFGIFSDYDENGTPPSTRTNASEETVATNSEENIRQLYSSESVVYAPVVY